MHSIILLVLYLHSSAHALFPLQIPGLSKLNSISNKKSPFLILPGFGNSYLDYINPLGKGENLGFATSLNNRGYICDVVKIERSDWLQIAGALTSKEFYSNTCRPHTLFRWYYDKVDQAVRELVQRTGEPVTLLGHSAGGWLARGILCDGRWKYDDTDDTEKRKSSNENQPDITQASSDLVLGLITLGTPHYSPIGTMDMTRGAIKHVNLNYPGAYLANRNRNTIFQNKQQENSSNNSNNRNTDVVSQPLFYMCIGGTAVIADAKAPKNSIGEFAYRSYKQVTGLDSTGTVGDGVVPLSEAFLEGADCNLVLPGVYHSIQSENWYGGPAVVDRWLTQADTLAAATRALRVRYYREKDR